MTLTLVDLLLRLQDPNKPKRAMSAYFLYSQAFRKTVKEEHPEASFGETVRCVRIVFSRIWVVA